MTRPNWRVRASHCGALLAVSVSLVACGSGASTKPEEARKSTENSAITGGNFDATEFCGVAASAAADAALGEDLASRAASLRTIAAKLPTEVKTALTVSADAMDKMAEAAIADPTGKALSSVVSALSADTELVAAQRVIDATVEKVCSSAEGNNS